MSKSSPLICGLFAALLGACSSTDPAPAPAQAAQADGQTVTDSAGAADGSAGETTADSASTAEAGADVPADAAAELPPGDVADSGEVAAGDAVAPDDAAADASQPSDVPADSSDPDSVAPDTAPTDTAPTDMAPTDAAQPDAPPSETAATDAAVTGDAAAEVDGPDTAPSDTGPTDTAAPDTAAADTPAACQPTVPATEVCDGIDNDCDGATDSDANACADANACTDDSCAGKQGCKHLANTGACDDGQPCTVDSCANSVCSGTAKVCDDKDACTADSCSAGSCVFAPIGGCKACVGASDCADGNDCSTDSCTAGKCQNPPIPNCFGPTDFQYSGINLASSTVELNTQLSWSVQVVNLGKKVSYAALEAWLSADETIDANDYKLHVDAGTTGPMILGSGTPMKTFSYVKTPGNNLSGAHKFLCARVTSNAVDPTPENNAGCTELFVKLPDWKIVTVKPAKASWNWNDDPYATTVNLINAGTAAPLPGYSAMLKLYLSADNKWDSGDVSFGALVDTGLLAVKSAKDFTVTANLAIGATDPKFLCARAMPNNQILEANTADNVLCVPHTFAFAGDIKLAPVVKANQGTTPPTDPPGFALSPATLQTGRYGVTPACRIAYITNQGEAVMKGYGVRCWIQTGAAGSANPSKLWELKGISTLEIPAKGNSPPYQLPNAVFNGLPDGQFLPGPAVAGKPQPVAMTMCMAFNEDGAVPEKYLADNQVCADIQVTALDLGWANLVGPTAPSVTTIKAGTASKVSQTHIKNFGSIKSVGGTANPSSVRLVLSADATYSADDVVLWSVNVTTPVEPGQTVQISNVNVGSTDVGFTIPANTVPGAWYLVMKIDATDVEPESTEKNNAWSAAITVN